MKRCWVAGAVLAVTLACAVACNDDPESHVYVASLYDPIDACFGASLSLGYVETADGSLACTPTCLVLSSDQPKKVYVSTMCGPYPVQYDASQTDPACQTALLAWPAEATALGNGTNTCAMQEASDDGGDDSSATTVRDAGYDSASDASSDAQDE